ncbi:MAG TPA: transglutaminase family protein [Candidatus Binataceae bacterium]
MRFRIRHVTRFAYESPAYESHNEIRLAPRPSPGQKTLGFKLDVMPPSAVVDFKDSFGNIVHAISTYQSHRELLVVADSLVERIAPRPIGTPRRPFSDFLAGDEIRSQEEYDFLHPSRYVPLSEPLKRFFWMARPSLNESVPDYVGRVISYVNGQFAYEPGRTNVNSDADQILSVGAGVCQDFAHLTIGVLRLAGVPARYVSGYLAPFTPDPQQRPLGAQATHAWIEAMLPDAGWTGFDPTNGSRTTERHIRVAVGRDYADVSPLHGVYRSAGSKQTMCVTLDVTQDFAEPPSNPARCDQ